MKPAISQLVGKIRSAFTATESPTGLSFPWGVVETTAPLTVSVPLSSALPVTSSAVPADLLRVGDRVLCIWQDSKLIVVDCPAVATRLSMWQGARIPAGSDFNTYTTPGHWFNPMSAEVAAMANRPPSGQAGALQVLNSAGTIQLWREYNTAGQGLTWRRRLYAGAWSGWWVEDNPEWGRWKAYSPAMSHTGYNGGATLAGRYTTFRDTMQGTITVKVASPANMGTGLWIISLPQAARAYNLVTGVGHYYIGSAAWVVSVVGAGTGTIGVLAAGAGRISASTPGAVGTTTELTISFQAELSGAP